MPAGPAAADGCSGWRCEWTFYNNEIEVDNGPNQAGNQSWVWVYDGNADGSAIGAYIQWKSSLTYSDQIDDNGSVNSGKAVTHTEDVLRVKAKTVRGATRIATPSRPAPQPLLVRCVST
ncbi:hypothetical protein [Streptomyces narbonensis]|uniref:hypothetical protein n=1 Tax=Streptomyces narbonensis TaxID=67333 RepID=UPI001673EB21|nr:hypothetical protein [Streptomyces narbonensis]GGW08597.1 hypothetical protein GCM10010230_55810 [Streptomyces narbonensis]